MQVGGRELELNRRWEPPTGGGRVPPLQRCPRLIAYSAKLLTVNNYFLAHQLGRLRKYYKNGEMVVNRFHMIWSILNSFLTFGLSCRFVSFMIKDLMTGEYCINYQGYN